MPTESIEVQKDYGWNSDAYTKGNYIYPSIYVFLYALTFVIVLTTNHYIKNVWKIYWFPETVFTIAISASLGLLCYHTGYTDSFNTFSFSSFFYLLLPPIIFFSAFQQNLRLFQKFFIEITAIANLGTLISAVVIGSLLYLLGDWGLMRYLSLAECMSFGALISATDPVSTLSTFSQLKVEPMLYVIILGSSIIDDAISVVLFTSMNAFIGPIAIDFPYIFLTVLTYFIVNIIASTVLGILCGLGLVYGIKKFSQFKRHTDILIGLVVASAYMSYMLATFCQISGIICCLFTSFTFRRYCPKLLHLKIYDDLCKFIGQISFIFENLAFISVGLSFTYEPMLKGYDLVFIAYSYLALLIGRMAFVYPMSYILNEINFKRNKMTITREDERRLQFFSCYNRARPISHGEIIGALNSAEYELKSVKGKQQYIKKRQARSTDTSDLAHPRDEEPQYLWMNIQHVIMLAGLRGPISYASALMFPNTLGNRELIVTTTRAMIILTIVLQASPISNVLSFLDVRTNVEMPPEDDNIYVRGASHYTEENKTFRRYIDLEFLEFKFILPYLSSEAPTEFDEESSVSRSESETAAT